MRGYNFIPVATVVMEKLPYTLSLVIPVLLIGFFVGNWIGARAAYVKGKRSEAVYFASVITSQMRALTQQTNKQTDEQTETMYLEILK